jgi:hypothetical protein
LSQPCLDTMNVKAKQLQQQLQQQEQLQQQHQQQFTNTVERITLRVNLKEGREHVEDTSQRASVKQLAGDGPLTVLELQELSLLCTLNTSASSMSSSSSSSTAPTTASSQQQQQQTGFASVDGDQLVALTELLDRHVHHAAQVHLLPQACHVLQQHSKSPSQAAAALDKVRALLYCCTLHYSVVQCNTMQIATVHSFRIPLTHATHIPLLPFFSSFQIKSHTVARVARPPPVGCCPRWSRSSRN